MRALRVLGVVVLITLCVSGNLQAEDPSYAAMKAGEKALEENRLDDAVAAFEQCLKFNPRDYLCAYSLASAYSRKQDAAAAVTWLGRAADWGFEKVDKILKDDDLTNIRSHSGYAQVIEDIQNRLPASKPRPFVATHSPERGMELVAMLRSELGSGAGIILSHEGDRIYVATANHVVRQGGAAAQTIEVQLNTPAPRWRKARLLPAIGDPELDLAIVALEGITGTELDFCKLPLDLGGESSPLHRGDPVYPVGYPGGILWAMPLAPDHASQVFPNQISFESQLVRVGFSGGALLNKEGEIVGMITADEPPLGRVVPLKLILDAVRKAGYPVQLSSPAERASGPLHVAAKAGDVAAIRRLLENCADPNASDATGRTPLHEAAAKGSADAVRLLVSAGARLHAWTVIREEKSDREWGTPLHLAAEHGRVEAVKALLLGEDVGLPTLRRHRNDEIDRGITALHIAARHDRGDVAEALLAAGAELEGHWRDGLTPLGTAAENGSVGAARVLLQHGAALQPPDGGDSFRMSPWLLAAAAGKVNVLQLFIEHGADVNATNPKSWAATALHAAAANGHTEAAAFLISQKAVVDAPGYQGNTPLYVPAKEGYAAVVELLLAHGANPNSQTGISEGNETPIEAAARRDHLDVLKLLVKAKADIGYLLHDVLEREKVDAARILIQGGADVLLTDGKGKQPLHIAAEEGLTEAVDLLLKAGAPVDAVDADGRTPLHRAAEDNQDNRQPAIIDLLMAAKAPINARDRLGKTALYIAASPADYTGNRAAVVDRLLRAGADPNIEVQSAGDLNTAVAAASTGAPDILALLLAAGGDPNRKGDATVSPLYLAAKSRKAEEKVRMLLKAGAKVVTKGEKASPLHAALSQNRDEAVAIIGRLLAAGAPVDPTDEKGRTPLHDAVDHVNTEAVRALVAGGASVHAADKCGATPLRLALADSRVESQAFPMAEIFVAAGADVRAKSTCSPETLLELAEKRGYWKVRQLLLSKGAAKTGQ